MRNCLVMGSGRSGTSMVTGALAKAGYFMGEHLVPARDANPKGFFEDVEVNMINEAILGEILPGRVVALGREFFRSRPLLGQRWLARVPVGAKLHCAPEVIDKIRTVTQQQPFCFKDPRFCYTLPIWRPFLDKAAFICVFRDPGSTAWSILKECREATYLNTLAMSPSTALKVWRLMYSHILTTHRRQGDWLFVHYEQILIRDGLRRLESFLDAAVDYTFPDASLRRSLSTIPVSRKIGQIYEKLCELAGYQEFTSAA